VATFGYICVGLVVAFVLFIAWATWSQLKKEKRIREEGADLLCWIVMANPKLYEKNDKNGYSYAVAVCSFDKRVTTDELEEIALKLPRFKQLDMQSRDEQIIASVMRTQIPYTRPLLLPEQTTGGKEAYLVSLNVYWNLLPQRRLNMPYIWAQVLAGDGGGSLMIEYPKDDPAHAQRDDVDDD